MKPTSTSIEVGFIFHPKSSYRLLSHYTKKDLRCHLLQLLQESKHNNSTDQTERN